MEEPKGYTAKYKCLKCGHKYEIIQGVFACPPGHLGEEGTPCGISRRRYFCSQCVSSKNCPKCKHLYVKWLNYEERRTDEDHI